MSTESTFYADLKSLRLKKGFSQREAAEMLHIPVKTLQNWESNRTKPPVYVQELCFDKLHTYPDIPTKED